MGRWVLRSTGTAGTDDATRSHRSGTALARGEDPLVSHRSGIRHAGGATAPRRPRARPASVARHLKSGHTVVDSTIGEAALSNSATVSSTGMHELDRTPSGPPRARRRSLTAELLLVAALPLASLASGCTSLAMVTPLPLQVDLPVSTAAWLAAETCRRELPSADPMPFHAAAPIVSLGAAGYEVRYSHARDGAWGVALNGRIDPPALAAPPPFVLAECRFRPQPASSGRGDTVLIVRVVPQAQGARVDVRGDAALARRVTTHLRAALALAETVQTTGRLLATGSPAAAEHLASRAITAPEPGCCAGHAPLTALVQVHAALALQAHGDLAGSRMQFAAALAHGMRLPGVPQLLCGIDECLARDRDATHALRSLASSPAAEWSAHLARCRLTGAARELAAGSEDAARHEHAARLLRQGAAERAIDRLQKARGDAPPTARELALLAAAYRRQGLHRSAYQAGLAELELDGLGAALALRLSEDSLQLHDAPSALRWLARAWPELQHTHAAAARQTLARASERAGADVTARVLLAEGAADLAAAAIERWQDTAAPDAAPAADLAVAALEHAAALRLAALPFDASRAPRASGFELAPGVSPMR